MLFGKCFKNIEERNKSILLIKFSISYRKKKKLNGKK